jgi:hypothetical protein
VKTFGRRSLRPFTAARVLVGLPAVFVALLTTASPALAWQSTYVQNKYVFPATWYGTGFQPSIKFNLTQWNSTPGVGMGLTYCRPDSSCYNPLYGFTGYLEDNRTISYGQSWCGGYPGNQWAAYVYQCYTYN